MREKWGKWRSCENWKNKKTRKMGKTQEKSERKRMENGGGNKIKYQWKRRKMLKTLTKNTWKVKKELWTKIHKAMKNTKD